MVIIDHESPPAPTGAAAPRRKPRSSEAAGRRALLYPGVIVVGIITQLPFLLTLYLSLFSWNLSRPRLGRHFTGFDNYVNDVFTGEFLTILVQTLVLTFVALAACCVIGLGLALLLNRDFRGKAVVQTLLVTPFFVMPVVTGLMWKNELFNPSIGLISYFADLLGADDFNPLAQHSLMMVATMVIWQWLPLFMLTLLAGLQSVGIAEKEAAQIDGCSRFKIFRHIEFPHLITYYRMVILLGTLFILQVFGQIQVSTAGGPGNSSMNLQFWTYQTALVGTRVGAASALGVATLVITLALLALLMKAVNSLSNRLGV